MSYTALSLLLGALLLGTPAWSAEISIPAYSGNTGSSVVTAISYAAQGATVSAVQLDLEYDNSQLSVVSVVIGDAGRGSQKLIYSSDVSSNKKRILITGVNQNPLPDGVLAYVFVNLNDTATAGNFSLKLSAVICSDPFGQLVPAVTLDGSILVNPASNGITPVAQAGVMNAASLHAGPIAPGELVTLIGSSIGPTNPVAAQGSSIRSTLGGTTLFVNGIASPLLYVSANQINAVIPFGVSGDSANLVVETQGQQSPVVTLPLATSAPALFTIDSTGVGAGAILNEDYSINTPSNPAARGSVVSIFATGAGQMDPPGTDGKLADSSALGKPIMPVSIRIGGIAVDPLYAGGAPGIIAGVIQVNFVVPGGVVPGLSVSLSVQIGSVQSPGGVTIAVN